MISRIRAIPLKNDQEVFRLCRLAAEKGDAKAQYNLAVMYSKGTGVAKDDQEGMKWYRAAAEQGNAAAQFYLGTICEKALEVAQNNQEAKVWGHAFGSSNPFYK